jgi:3-oxoacyl-[acyl-carrier protein] reductase
MAAERVLVIGGGRGIGLAVAEAWAAGGHDVTVVARRRPEPAGLRFIEADLESPASTAAMLDAYTASAGAPRAVVFAQRARAQRTEWTSEMRVSVEATRQIIEGVAGPMQAAGGGAVVVIGSHARHLVAAEQPAEYHASKAALAQLVRYYAVTLGPAGIRVNGVVPGSVDKGTQGPGRPHPDAGIIPLRRVPVPADIAQAVLFLCGPGSACITGQHLVVDGGLSLVFQGTLARQVVEER